VEKERRIYPRRRTGTPGRMIENSNPGGGEEKTDNSAGVFEVWEGIMGKSRLKRRETRVHTPKMADYEIDCGVSVRNRVRRGRTRRDSGRKRFANAPILVKKERGRYRNHLKNQKIRARGKQ